MIRRLVVSHGHRERELALVGTIVVGRDPECDVSEDGDSLLSRRHTEFALGPNGVVVRDLGSRNGTFVNGVKTVESAVEPGDVVQIGHLLVRLVEGDAPLPVRTPPSPDADADATRLMQAPRPPAVTATATPADDDRTLIVARPNAGAAWPAAARPAAAASAPARAAEGDTDRTMIVRRAVQAPAPAPRAPLTPAPVPAAPAAAARDGAARSASVQVTLLSAVVFLSGASALLFGNDAGASASLPLWRWAPGLVVAVIATVAAATVINRRLARTGETAGAPEARR